MGLFHICVCLCLFYLFNILFVSVCAWLWMCVICKRKVLIETYCSGMSVFWVHIITLTWLRMQLSEFSLCVGVDKCWYGKTVFSSSFQEFDFLSVRVDSPLVMVVNGSKVKATKQAASVLSVRTVPEWLLWYHCCLILSLTQKLEHCLSKFHICAEYIALTWNAFA